MGLLRLRKRGLVQAVPKAAYSATTPPKKLAMVLTAVGMGLGVMMGLTLNKIIDRMTLNGSPIGYNYSNTSHVIISAALLVGILVTSIGGYFYIVKQSRSLARNMLLFVLVPALAVVVFAMREIMYVAQDPQDAYAHRGFPLFTLTLLTMVLAYVISSVFAVVYFVRNR
jgi:hypothetical protein